MLIPTLSIVKYHRISTTSDFLQRSRKTLKIYCLSIIIYYIAVDLETIMKRTATIFLRVVIVLIGIVALIILIRFPLMEGRAAKLDLFSVYADPFILYGYAASIAFFVALYKAFKLLGYIGQNKVFSSKSVSALKSIKYCAIILSILIVTAGVYIRISHNKDDDPVGFLVMCVASAFLAVIVATAAAIFEKILQNAREMKSENELTI
jgi:hypothetical protein